ncbi:hypothetical protein D9M69_511470 [compost metagenome]
MNQPHEIFCFQKGFHGIRRLTYFFHSYFQHFFASQITQRLVNDQSFAPALKAPLEVKLAAFFKDPHHAFHHHIFSGHAVFDVATADGQKFPGILFIESALGVPLAPDDAPGQVVLCFEKR